MEIVASGADNAPPLPADAENIAAVVSGKLYVRQRPGPANSLGLAKFIFPELATTSTCTARPRSNCSRSVRRDFSHGCIRLEDPARFAEWVLREDPDWTARKDRRRDAGRQTDAAST